jgi:signal transduction histidine kinase
MDAVDREPSLRELLPTELADRIVAALQVLVEGPVAIEDPIGEVLAGPLGLKGGPRIDLVVEIEPAGRLVAPGTSLTRAAAAASLVVQVMMARRRFQMASRVHLASTESDYERLQQQNAALAASEASLRVLSATLEQRVAMQAKIIDERQRQLYQAERLASVGQLAAGLAHEINNPIGFVRSNLGSAGKYLDRFDGLRESLRALPEARARWSAADMDYLLADFRELLIDCIEGVDRVARIVADLKGMSPVDQPRQDHVVLDRLVENACSLAMPALPPGARLESNLAAPDPVTCFPDHLLQALQAVIMNAVQAIDPMGADGRVVVTSRRIDDRLQVCVGDNGPGIPPEVLPRVFDPFFTTRPVGKGTGLGLTVARDILQAHGGSISFDSAPGQGTTVTMRIPA